MPYGPVKFRSTVVKLYNYNPDCDINPGMDDPEDIVYTEGLARPSRLKVRVPAAPAPLAAITPIAVTYLSPATGSNQARPLLLLLARVVSDVIINKD